MDIIIKGATELNLNEEYINNLKSIPIAVVPIYLEYLAKKNYFFIGFLFRKKLRFITMFMSRLLWMFYYKGAGVEPFLMAHLFVFVNYQLVSYSDPHPPNFATHCICSYIEVRDTQ